MLKIIRSWYWGNMKKVLAILVISLCFTAYAKPKPKHHMALKDNLIGYWNFEQEPQTFSTHDQSGNGNHFVTQNASVASTEGKIGQGVQMAPVDSVAIGLHGIDSGDFSHHGSPFTVAFWYRPLLLNPPYEIAGSDGEWFVQQTTNGTDSIVEVRIDPSINNYTLDLVDVPLVAGIWYFIALGWDGTHVWATINMTPRVRTAVASLLSSSHAPDLWNGSVFDEMAMWRRSVTANELFQIYNDGDGLSFTEWDAERECATVTCCN